MKKRLSAFIRENSIFFPFLLILLIFLPVFPQKIKDYPKFVDWKTIITLFGLLIITNGIKESSFLRFISRKYLVKIKNERLLALYFILLASIFSMILTNDIALFIIVPLTVSFQEILKNDLKKIVIFEAIAVNVGSTLTPIGNPQNLFLWHRWDIPFLRFMLNVFPLFIIMFSLLILLTFFVFKNKSLIFKPDNSIPKTEKNLFYFSLSLLIIFVISIEADFYLIVLIVFILFLLFFRKTLSSVDYPLLILFIIMFIDFHLLSEVSAVSILLKSANLSNPKNLFLSSIAFSQIMSNVPASIFISKFSNNWKIITYGVNVGGNGLLYASLANIIALRFIKDRKILIEYHKYSFFYLILSTILTIALIF